jgi:hypothetical protein
MAFLFYYLHISLIYNKQRVISPAEPPAGFSFCKSILANLCGSLDRRKYCPPERSKACDQHHCEYRNAPFTWQVEREKLNLDWYFLVRRVKISKNCLIHLNTAECEIQTTFFTKYWGKQGEEVVQSSPKGSVFNPYRSALVLPPQHRWPWQH